MLSGAVLQEGHSLEWKSCVDLGQREWQARVARFVLGAANRPPALAGASRDGHAFILLGVEPRRACGTKMVDPALLDAGLARFLGTAGPGYVLDYVTLGAGPRQTRPGRLRKKIPALTEAPVGHFDDHHDFVVVGRAAAVPELRMGRLLQRLAGPPRPSPLRRNRPPRRGPPARPARHTLVFHRATLRLTAPRMKQGRRGHRCRLHSRSPVITFGEDLSSSCRFPRACRTGFISAGPGFP